MGKQIDLFSSTCTIPMYIGIAYLPRVKAGHAPIEDFLGQVPD